MFTDVNGNAISKEDYQRAVLKKISEESYIRSSEILIGIMARNKFRKMDPQTPDVCNGLITFLN